MEEILDILKINEFVEREFYAELFVLRSIVQFTKNHVNCLVSQ